MNFELKGGPHYFDLFLNGKKVDLPHQVGQALEFQGKLIVLLAPKPDSGDLSEQNVIALDNEGRILWKIDQMYRVGSGNRTNQCTGIWIDEENRLIASTWLCFEYVVNPDNGRITVINLGQRPW
jgi:hypothetical protein